MFKILQLTDLHFGNLLPESSHIDQVTKALIMRLIHTNQPDFIAITGDLIWSKPPNSLSTFRDVLEFINSFNIPFAATFGNCSGLKMLFFGGLKMSFFSGLRLSHI
ncbi:hypothetical protein GTN30_02650 [Macrococcoides canis]|uniref:Calcineurin-like phosphoesterase domain-containing protein n=1 Tax=Macrococcoides canis TaxID=1855823 RepID=A0AAE6WZ95_9STAP|nr:metallophosphoesterase [Macrococcus canis]QIH77556.1 hypothetical protein GTN30_02650 [Macrococcus canis]